MTTSLPFSPPVVTGDDYGIRPAGRPDACFYCNRRVGERHAFECVIVRVPRTYRVILDGADVGTWTVGDPVSWNAEAREFHRNESSWCANNVRSEGTLLVTDDARVALLNVTKPGKCELCPRVEFIPVADEPEYYPGPT